MAGCCWKITIKCGLVRYQFTLHTPLTRTHRAECSELFPDLVLFCFSCLARIVCNWFKREKEEMAAAKAVHNSHRADKMCWAHALQKFTFLIWLGCHVGGWVQPKNRGKNGVCVFDFKFGSISTGPLVCPLFSLRSAAERIIYWLINDYDCFARDRRLEYVFWFPFSATFLWFDICLCIWKLGSIEWERKNLFIDVILFNSMQSKRRKSEEKKRSLSKSLIRLIKLWCCLRRSRDYACALSIDRNSFLS